MEREPSARWWVLGNVFAMNFVATGMAWTYVVVLVAPILADHGLALRDWGVLWSGLSMGALLGALPAGALAVIDAQGLGLTALADDLCALRLTRRV